MKKELFGHTRTEIHNRHALITRDGYVPSSIPGWESAECNIAVSGGLGARMNMWFASAPGGATVHGTTGDLELLLYVLEGAAGHEDHDLVPGSYVFLPPGSEYSFEARKNSRWLVFEKRYEPLPSVAPPGPIVGNQEDAAGEPFLGDPDALLQTLLPDMPAFDMAVNIFTYQPGATLPFVETHAMEHGLLMLRGQGVYRLDDRHYPVREGDVIWIAPWCPQWFVCMGKEPASYIYYKDINRHPKPIA
jgi:(S)-ureidoglycine aminohydrolase